MMFAGGGDGGMLYGGMVFSGDGDAGGRLRQECGWGAGSAAEAGWAGEGHDRPARPAGGKLTRTQQHRSQQCVESSRGRHFLMTICSFRFATTLSLFFTILGCLQAWGGMHVSRRGVECVSLDVGWYSCLWVWGWLSVWGGIAEGLTVLEAVVLTVTEDEGLTVLCWWCGADCV